ncbi:hypothetical protein KNE206_61490 [Kitasatospora sp. NE20-6]|uniref:hypothetical protein n=1 Tax=Kitasatospora sp. NE20-6 TaxID=2859066 RepID=UPI0034DC49DE
MTRRPALPGTVARFPFRPLTTVAMTALAALSLAACGTGTAGPAGPASTPAGAVGAGPGLTEVLGMVEQSCPPSAPPQGPPAGPAHTLPPGVGVPPDVEPLAPTAGPEAELNARDWCAASLHEERIAQALGDLTDPTPGKVRTILNHLGYTDDRIHDLKQSGASTRFFLDLRDNGGRLCLEGSAAAKDTVVDKCVAPPSGPFTPGEQKQAPPA